LNLLGLFQCESVPSFRQASPSFVGVEAIAFEPNLSSAKYILICTRRPFIIIITTTTIIIIIILLAVYAQT
jgi:hypothetical protein